MAAPAIIALLIKALSAAGGAAGGTAAGAKAAGTAATGAATKAAGAGAAKAAGTAAGTAGAKASGSTFLSGMKAYGQEGLQKLGQQFAQNPQETMSSFSTPTKSKTTDQSQYASPMSLPQIPRLGNSQFMQPPKYKANTFLQGF